MTGPNREHFKRGKAALSLSLAVTSVGAFSAPRVWTSKAVSRTNVVERQRSLLAPRFERPDDYGVAGARVVDHVNYPLSVDYTVSETDLVDAADVSNETKNGNVGDKADGPDLGQKIFLEQLPAIAEALAASSLIRDGVVVNRDDDSGAASVDRGFAPSIEKDSMIPPVSPSYDAEIVQAVWAVSAEAVAAAEFKLSPDVADKLSFVPDPVIEVTATAAESAMSAASIMPVTEPAEKTEVPQEVAPLVIPSVGKILKFAIPAIGVWLCGPLLSLIDTASVGILSGTTQQAALNPAVAVTDYAALLIAFLYTATTNLIAAARATDRSLAGSPRTTSTLIGAMQLSVLVGAGLGATLFAFARPLLRTIIGNDAMSPAVFDAALNYVRIRALGMPAAAVIGSAQAACLGMQDIRSPLYVLLAAAIVNFCGDMLFVGSTHRLIGGTAGAAWATVFSQFAAVGLFVHWLTHKKPENAPKSGGVINLTSAVMELTGKSRTGAKRRERLRVAIQGILQKYSNDEAEGGKIDKLRGSVLSKSEVKGSNEKLAAEDGFSVRGFLQDRFRAQDLLRLPNTATVNDFVPYMLPVSTTQVGRVSGYVAMAHVVSSSLGTVSMAAQQVIVSLFYCLCPIADSLSLTAQSFVPALAERKPSLARSQALRQTALNFLKAGTVFGSVMVGAVSCIPLLSQFFTSDPVVSSLVNTVVPFLLGIFAVHGLVCSGEGLLLGQKDLGFLGKMYAVYFVVVPYFMLRVKRAALVSSASVTSAVSLTSVWQVFLCYQLVRCTAWMGRVAMLQRQTERSHAPADDSVPVNAM